MTDKLKKFAEIPVGSNAYISFLVMEANARVNVKGSDYVDLTATDGDASVSVKLWNTSLFNSGIKVGDVLTARVDAKEYKGNTSFSLQNFKIEPDMDAGEFLLKPPVPIEEMWEWVHKRISWMKEPYKSLCEQLVIKNEVDYCRSAAGKSVHHSFLGGLLYHSYRMARSGDMLAPLYGCDADLVVAGCLCHDIGKLKELSTSWTGAAEYTAKGQLEGHLALGMEMLTQAARKANVSCSTEEFSMLRHIIASHHGQREFGAVKEPMTKEAMLVHQLDVTDMQLEAWDETAAAMEPGQVSASPVPALGHRIYIPACS